MRKTKTDLVRENIMHLVGNTFYASLAHQLTPLLSMPGGLALRMTVSCAAIK